MIIFQSFKEIFDKQFRGSGNIVIYGFDHRIKRFCRELEEETGFKIKGQKEILIVHKSIVKDLYQLKKKLDRYRFRYEIY